MSDYRIQKVIYLPCGSEAHFDYDSGISYRCTTCFAVIGSIGQPSECQNEANKYAVLRAMGSKVRWNYTEGREETI